MKEELFYVTGKTENTNFSCGFVLNEENVVTRAAPILMARGFLGKSMGWARKYCRDQDWAIKSMKEAMASGTEHVSPERTW